MAYSADYISLITFFFFFFVTSSVGQSTVPAAFVFGDSLVDVGNNNHLEISLAKANFPHNGVDFPGGKATGRFSNGKNAADFLAMKLGLPTSPPYLSLARASNKSQDAYLKGVSFASGGAGIMDGTDKIFRQALTLNKQIEYYTRVHGELVQHLGPDGAQNFLAKSIFVVVIGSNDILGQFGSSGNPVKNNPQQFIDSLVLYYRGQLKKIYDQGARRFVVAGVGAIGCCPSQRNQNKTGGCNEEANDWSVKFNEGVKSMLQGMQSELKDMKYSFFDTFRTLFNIIENPAKYGFVEVKSACCGLGRNNAKVACLPISHYCPNRRDHVFWDLYHPTEATSSMFVDIIYEGTQQYVFPVNLKQLVTT